ncbi:MAG TPA: hypothetical protein VIK51_08705, partial [Vicinamibacteria bacterium]
MRQALRLTSYQVAEQTQAFRDGKAALVAVRVDARALDQLHDQVGDAIVASAVEQAGDVRMIERGHDLAAQLRVTRADLVQVRDALVCRQGNGP